VEEFDYAVRSVHIVVWICICELERLAETETRKSSNVYVAQRPLPVLVVQPCDFGGVTKVSR
jgi:hypothetical protein